MKVSILAATLLSTLSVSSFAQVSTPIDNQCRSQAKEVAVKTYQTCVAETRSAEIERIRKEYQEKISALKSDYESQLQALKTGKLVAKPAPVEIQSLDSKPAQGAAPAIENSKVEEVPADSTALKSIPADDVKPEAIDTGSDSGLDTTPLPEKEVAPETSLVPTNLEPVQDTQPIQQEDLTLNEPTVTLKPAQPKQAQNKNSKKISSKKPIAKVAKKTKTPVVPAVVKTAPFPAQTKNQNTYTNTSTPQNPTVAPASKSTTPKKAGKTVAQKRAQGEKGVKGVAKALPAKQKAVETKPASDVITENQISKTAPIQVTDLEKSQISQNAPLEETTVNEKSVDSDLGGAQATEQSAQ